MRVYKAKWVEHVSLNVRLARLALTETGRRFSGRRLRKRFAALLAAGPPLARTAGFSATDGDVRGFIRAAFAETPRPRVTPLLQRYRRSGRACNQSRFMGLYRQIEEEVDGS
jgi:hypothetical protein